MLALEGAKLAAHGTAAEPYVNKIPTWLPLLASEGSGLAGLARHKLGLPPTAAAEAAAEAEAGAASRVAPSAPAITRAEVEQQLNQSLGGTPLQRGVPLRQQPGFPGASAQAEATTAAIPRDFTPVKSSAIRAYKYDPVRKEFESITTDGQHYVHSDISPADVTEFEASTSKGAAWGKLKSLGVLTAKVVGGKRVPVRPISLRSSEAIRNALSKKNR
jgi:hypothetical protein